MSEPQQSHLRIVHNAADAPDLPLPVDEPVEEVTDEVPSTELEPIVDAEVVKTPRHRKTEDRPVRVINIYGRTMAVQPSPRTVAVARFAVVPAITIGAGWHSWLVRAYDALTYGDIRRQIRIHDATKNSEALGEWRDRHLHHVTARRNRLMDLPVLALNLAKFLGISVISSLFLLLVLSTAIWATGVGDFGAIWEFMGGLIRLILTVIKYAWPAIPAAMLAASWREGRRRGGVTPAWLSPNVSSDDAGAPITPSLVVIALRDLGIPSLRKAIKDMGDSGAAMLGLIRIAGCGVEVDVNLPSGVSTAEVQDRRRKLAENLGRHEHEVFITIPKAARTVRLWIADSGALDEPIGPSPLVLDPEMTADLYTGRAPWGQDLRGDAAHIALLQRHLLITGLSNQGKTAALRALALWLALDTSVEFRVADLKGVGDWRMFDGLATVLIQGPTDDHVVAATEMLEQGVAEMESRITALERSGATDGVTRQMARTNPRFKPLVLIVDEAQVAFMCPAREQYVTDDDKVREGAPYGGTKSTSKYFMAARKLHNQGRAVNVVLWQGTQDPTDQNLPKLVREGAHIRASLVVGTEAQAKMALGEKAVDAGAAPHRLRQGLDKGTLVVAGDGVDLPAGQSSITIRTHFVSGEDAAEVADRAKARRRAVDTRESVVVDDQSDPCDDIVAVLGDTPRMSTQEVLQRLTERNPRRYREWNHPDLKRVLEEIGAGPYKSDGRMVVGRDRVLRGLAQREEISPDGRFE
ncbi:MAG: FtsK/SpoIIIE domain-containing protein [Gemmatimonadaceae bacterium]